MQTFMEWGKTKAKIMETTRCVRCHIHASASGVKLYEEIFIVTLVYLNRVPHDLRFLFESISMLTISYVFGVDHNKIDSVCMLT